MLNKINQNSLNTLITEDSHFENILNECSDDVQLVFASETAVRKKKKNKKNTLKTPHDEVENKPAIELMRNIILVKQGDASLKPKICSNLSPSIALNARIIGANVSRGEGVSLTKKEASLLVPNETKVNTRGENLFFQTKPKATLFHKDIAPVSPSLTIKDIPTSTLDDTKQYGHGIEHLIPKEKTLMVLNRVSVESQGVRFASESSSFILPCVNSLYVSQNQKWPIVFATNKEVVSSSISIEDTSFLKNGHKNIVGVELNSLYLDNINLNHGVFNKTSLVNLNHLNYSLSPTLFWQYPQVNSYRVFFARKYYLFTFENNKVTSFLEEYYDRT